MLHFRILVTYTVVALEMSAVIFRDSIKDSHTFTNSSNQHHSSSLRTIHSDESGYVDSFDEDVIAGAHIRPKVKIRCDISSQDEFNFSMSDFTSSCECDVLCKSLNISSSFRMDETSDFNTSLKRNSREQKDIHEITKTSFSIQ